MRSRSELRWHPKKSHLVPIVERLEWGGKVEGWFVVSKTLAVGVPDRSVFVEKLFVRLCAAEARESPEESPPSEGKELGVQPPLDSLSPVRFDVAKADEPSVRFDPALRKTMLR